jgi:hypothetical protein
VPPGNEGRESRYFVVFAIFCLAKAAFNEHKTHTTQQQEPVAMSPGEPKKEQDMAQDRAWTI